MKTARLASIFALLMLGFAAAAATGARGAGPSASGNYRFSLEDGFAKSLLFEAAGQGGGAATGEMFFTDEMKITYRDDDDPDDKGVTYDGYYLKAEFDGLLVEDNRAVMIGTVRDSNINALIGERVLLTVEDNGDSGEKPDRLTWGVYKPTDKSWTPSDADWDKDPGVGLTWWATDEEQKGDVGYQMPRDETITARTFPIPSYDFAEVARSEGDIKVLP